MSRKSSPAYTLDLFSQVSHPAAGHPDLVWPEAARHDELLRIAENYWTLGVDYNDRFIALLEKLLSWAQYHEAQAYLRGEYLPDGYRVPSLFDTIRK